LKYVPPNLGKCVTRQKGSQPEDSLIYSDIRCGYINELTQINWKKMNYLAASCGELDPKRD
jgi:hypothetical protein